MIKASLILFDKRFFYLLVTIATMLEREIYSRNPSTYLQPIFYISKILFLMIWNDIDQSLVFFNILVSYVTWTRIQVSDTVMCSTRVLLNFCKFFHIFEGSERHTNVRICVRHGYFRENEESM